MAKTYREVLSRASSFLEAAGKEGYAIQFVFLNRKNWQKLDWLLQMNQPITPADEMQIAADLEQLLANQPPQYLLGYADFYESRFQVTPATLIPRPETEELVALCLSEVNQADARVVDVGTGSGAIAVSLKLERPTWDVTAIDLSPGALRVAKENAQNLGADIAFYLGDGLQPLANQKIDVLISNPPYISHDEWALMDESVREFEPKMALFAENDGLAIYQQLAKEVQGLLTPCGQIFLEIGFQQGKAVQAIFQQAFPSKKVTILKDLAQNERMIHVK
ncbi:MAG: peptide chain release factor N(5)-glutamine methyltransferase [Enterococcus sp.]